LQTEIEGVGRSPAAFMGSLTGFGTVTLEQARLVGLNPEVFGAVVRAIELGIPTEGNRIREFVGGALDNAGLPVAKASAALTISAGQARLRDVVIKADGADVQATVNVDLADAMLDALLTLNALPSATGAVPPAVMVALKGTLPAPKRTVDINLLTSWLTLRAVEQQSRQIEAMERAAREAAAAAAAAAAPPAPKAVEPTELPAAAPVLAPERGSALPATAPNMTSTVSGAVQVPALPPPVAIPAAPKPRVAPHVAPRAESVAPAPVPAPLLPPLLGSQN
jgi:large subunit ribosomal protein L24